MYLNELNRTRTVTAKKNNDLIECKSKTLISGDEKIKFALSSRIKEPKAYGCVYFML